MTSVALAVAQKMLQTSGTWRRAGKTLMGKQFLKKMRKLWPAPMASAFFFAKAISS
jgi:hypothetical protein